MTDEALIIRIKRVLNEIQKRPSLNLFFRINPLLQEYKNTKTDSNNPKLVEFASQTYTDKDEFVQAFENATK